MAASILVVEDNPDSIGLIDYLLRAYGYAPALATNGRTGVRRALVGRPDLILLDVGMSEMDGYQVLAEVRGQPGLESTPIVAVTASVTRHDHERIVAAGFEGCIDKPIDPESFVAQVEHYLPPALRAGGDEGEERG